LFVAYRKPPPAERAACTNGAYVLYRSVDEMTKQTQRRTVFVFMPALIAKNAKTAVLKRFYPLFKRFQSAMRSHVKLYRRE
jgi:hypothetical protein